MKDPEYDEPRFGRVGVPTPSASGPRDPGTIPWLPSDPPRPSLENCDLSEQLGGAPDDDLGPGTEPEGPRDDGSVP